MLVRLTLAFVLAVPAFSLVLAHSLEADQTFAVRIRMSSSVSGTLQVAGDAGQGFGGGQSVEVLAGVARDYTVPIAPAAYQALRIDPGTAPGRYSIFEVSIVDSRGTMMLTIPLSALSAAHQLRVVEQGADRLVVVCPPDAFDPQLIYAPPAPFALRSMRSIAWSGAVLAGFVAMAALLVWTMERTCGSLAPPLMRWLSRLASGGARHPRVAVLLAALLGTLAACYPIVFLDRSLVTPANGGVAWLYDRPPFAPGVVSADVEDTRSSDVAAMMLAFVPYSIVQREALGGGEFPLWNRHNAIGRPLWGQGQTFLFDPLHWLTLLGSNLAGGWDLKFLAHRLVFAWGIGVAGLVATGRWLPSSAIAAASPFIGLFAYRFNHPAAFTVSYAPWVLVGWCLLASAGSAAERARGALLIAGASALLLFASPPKEAVVMLAVCHATGVLCLTFGAESRRTLAMSMGYLAMAGVATILVTAPQWWVFLDALRASVTYYDTPDVQFATAAFGVRMLLGPLVDGIVLPGVTPLTLPLVVGAVLAPRALIRQPLSLACLVMATIAGLVAFGAVPAAWISHVPLVANIQFINATFLTAAIVLALVASAAGLDILLRERQVRAWWAGIVTALVGVWVLVHLGGLQSLSRFEGWLALMAVVGMTLLPLALARASTTPTHVQPSVAATALIVLLTLPSGQHVETHLAPIDRILVQPKPRIDLEASSAAVQAVHRAQAHALDPARVLGLGGSLTPGIQAVYRMEGLGGPDALRLAAVDDVFNAPGPHPRMGWQELIFSGHLERDAPMLDMLNVGYLLARFEEVDSAFTEALQGADQLVAVRRPTAWPRAFFADRVDTYTTPADLVAQVRSRGQPLAAIQAGDPQASALASLARSGSGTAVPADAYRLTTNRTSFRVRSAGPGVAVLGEAFMAGDFLATLNGSPVPYYRVNHVFKAVTIPAAGDWTIAFEYRPHGWTRALGCAALGLGLIAILVLESLQPVAVDQRVAAR